MGLRQIVLMGYRGTGKTTVAELLARRLGWQWTDTDAEIERRAGRSIREIFAERGEPYFRELEAEVVAQWAGRGKTILALGGGGVLRAANRDLLSRSHIIWLTADADTIARRLGADPATRDQRPQLTVRGGRAEIEALLREREPVYRNCADRIVETPGKTADQVVDEIVCLLKQAFDLDPT